MLPNWEKLTDEEKLESLNKNIEILYSAENQLFFIKENSKKIRELVLSKTQSDEILELCVFDESVINRTLVAIKSKKIDVLKKLSLDPFIWVRATVAENKHIDREMIENFLFGAEKAIQSAVLRNPKIALYQDFLRRYGEKGKNNIMILDFLNIRTLPGEVFYTLMSGENNPSILIHLLSHDSIPHDLLNPYLEIFPDIKNRDVKTNCLNEMEKVLLKLVAMGIKPR